jgi:hypothetical protein
MTAWVLAECCCACNPSSDVLHDVFQTQLPVPYIDDKLLQLVVLIKIIRQSPNANALHVIRQTRISQSDV